MSEVIITLACHVAVLVLGILVGLSIGRTTESETHATECDYMARQCGIARSEALLWKGFCHWMMVAGATSHGWSEVKALAHADQETEKASQRIRRAVDEAYGEGD